MKIFLAGQTTFGNRGCEALVRSSSCMIHERNPEVEIICPLENPDIDRLQWPEAKSFGVDFVPRPIFPKSFRLWAKLIKVLPFVERFGAPRFKVDSNTMRHFKESDALIMTGGDVLSLEYGVASLYVWVNLIEKAMGQALPSILWAASVGPFSTKPHVEKKMIEHLKKYESITVRETISYNYLKGLGLIDVKLVADPAFNLNVEEFAFQEKSVLKAPEKLLGLNVSPLINEFRGGSNDVKSLDQEVLEFILKVLKNTDYSVLLVPHVDPLDGGIVNSDSHYMKKILVRLSEEDKARVTLLPNTLNASQLKYAISKCRFFIGARTHSTIAAFSTGVPTISIAYSIKAKGLNNDLFGSEKYILETSCLSADTLMKSLNLLEKDEAEIKSILQVVIPKWKDSAYRSVDVLDSLKIRN